MWTGVCLVFVLTILVVAFESAIHFQGSAIDGPFQLYNAMRRIQAGFRPGVDFQFFHGFGSAYIHYPLYRLLGGGLRGSELSRQLVASALCPLVFLVVFRTFAGSWRRALCLTAAALALSFKLNLMSALLFALNGMLGLRSALPTLVPVVLYLAPTRRSRTVGAGIVLGLALFVSTEQGLAAVLAYVIVSALALVRRADRRAQVLEAGGAAVGAIGVLVVCLIAVGGVAGMRGSIRYNFLIIPKDQYWFFGSPPNTFVPSWTDGIIMAVRQWPVGMGLALGVVAAGIYLRRLWRSAEGDAGHRTFALAFLPVYGLVSCASLLGVFVSVYAQPCWRAIFIVLLLEGMALAQRYDDRIARPEWLGVPRIVAAATFAVVLWSVATIRLIPSALFVALPHIVRDHAFGDARFGYAGIWPQTLADGQRVIDSHRGPRGELPVVWSTYAGWIEARNGLFHPSFDYIIHALGTENRGAYVAKFRATRPTLAQTVRPTYTQYEPWIENNEWEFYDELLRSYTVASTTPWSIFWERRSTSGPEPQLLGTMIVPAGMTQVSLPPVPATYTGPATLLEVEVEYEIRNPLHWLPIIGQSPRYLIGINGAVSQLPISLDPSVRHKRFPLLVRAGQTPAMIFRTLSLLPGASWAPRSLKLFVRPVDGPNQVWLADLVRRVAP